MFVRENITLSIVLKKRFKKLLILRLDLKNFHLRVKMFCQTCLNSNLLTNFYPVLNAIRIVKLFGISKSPGHLSSWSDQTQSYHWSIKNPERVLKKIQERS